MIMVVAACFRDSHVVAYLAVCSARANIQFFFHVRVAGVAVLRRESTVGHTCVI